MTIVGWPLSRLANKKDHRQPTFGDWDLGLPMAKIFMGHHATEFVESQLPYFSITTSQTGNKRYENW